MYRILIVDDEPIVRRGIKKSLNWNEFDIEMVAEAENGVEALEQVMETQPDIILLDICMPRMDGLEFAAIVRKRFPHIRIVIITGFHDFEYARSALRAGVDDYILKPITKEDVARIVTQQLERLKEQSGLAETTAKKEKQQATVLNALLKKEPCVDLLGLCESLRLAPDAPISLALLRGNVVRCELWKDEGIADLAEFALLNIAAETMEVCGAGVAFETYKSEVALLLTCRREEIAGALDAIARNIIDFIEISVEFGVSDAGMLSDLKTLRMQALEALGSKFVFSDQSVYYYRDVAGRDQNEIHYPVAVEAELLEKVFSADEETSGKLIDAFFDHILHSLPDAQKCRNALLRLMVKLSQTVDALNGRSIGESEYDNFDPIERVREFETMDAAREWLKRFYAEAYHFTKNVKSRSGQLFMQINQYIEKNYANSDLNLKKCSDDLFLSSSYISLILKKESRRTFVDYLNEYRIERAAELLKHPESKIYEVATQSGFTHPTYFSSVFKKIKGVSPKQFKEG